MTLTRSQIVRKLPAGVTPVRSCPDEVVRLLAVQYEDGKRPSDSYSAIWARMCCDESMEAFWASLKKQALEDHDWGRLSILLTSRMLRAAGDDQAFEKKTDQERLRWLDSTRATIVRLQNLLLESPGFVAENVIEAVSIEQMEHFLGVLGIVIRDGAEGYDANSNKWSISPWSFRRAQRGTSPIGIIEVLDVLLENMSEGVPSNQTIRKPRDAKARRARYILEITQDLDAMGYRVTDENVAVVARMAFNDESITAAIANKFRYRRGLSAMIGGEMQHSEDDNKNAG